MGRNGILRRSVARAAVLLVIAAALLALSAPGASAVERVVWASSSGFAQLTSSCATAGCSQYDYFASDYGTGYKGYARMAVSADGKRRAAHRWNATYKRWYSDYFTAVAPVVWVQYYADGYYWAWTQSDGWRVVRASHIIVARRVVT